MKVLLDTHTFLRWIADGSQLSSRARRIISDTSNEVYFSAASGWETAIKARVGRLSIGSRDIENFVAEQVAGSAFQVLPVHLSHALRSCSLPDHHRDPFDRLLIAQAITDELTLLNADREIGRYKVRIVW